MVNACANAPAWKQALVYRVRSWPGFAWLLSGSMTEFSWHLGDGWGKYGQGSLVTDTPAYRYAHMVRRNAARWPASLA